MGMLTASLVLILLLPQPGLGQCSLFQRLSLPYSFEVVPAGKGPPGDTLWWLYQG